jgi:hypothetical protein
MKKKPSSHAGGASDVTNITVTLDDDAPIPLPDNSHIVSGTYRPANYGTGDVWVPPASPPLGGSARSIFNGTDPNGTWSLYLMDDFPGDSGDIAGGWMLTTDSGRVTPTPYTHTYTYTYTHLDTYAYSYTNWYSDGYSHCNANCYCDGHTNRNAYSHADSNSYPHSDANGDTYSRTHIHTEAQSHTEATSHTASSRDAMRKED